MQDKDLVMAAHEAVEHAPGGMPPIPQEEPPEAVPPHEPRQYDCDIVVLGGAGLAAPWIFWINKLRLLPVCYNSIGMVSCRDGIGQERISVVR